MNQLTDSYTLHNGVQIPCVGFGTWKTPDGDVAENSVRTAIEAGYRHIDTAAIYGNEASVGRGIRASGVNREDLFVTTKLWNDVRGYNETIEAFHKSMEKLGLDYLDLYLIHWPNPARFRDNWQHNNAETWRAMEDLYKAGKIRAIGISNFRVHHMEALMETATVVPMVNQLRLCPGETQPEVTAWCREHQILCEAYSPLGNGRIFEVPEMKAIADKYGRSVAQVCIRWSLQMGYLPLPKSVTPARIVDNTHVFDFSLDEGDVAAIAAMTDCCGETPDPDTGRF